MGGSHNSTVQGDWESLSAVCCKTWFLRWVLTLFISAATVEAVILSLPTNTGERLLFWKSVPLLCTTIIFNRYDQSSMTFSSLHDWLCKRFDAEQQFRNETFAKVSLPLNVPVEWSRADHCLLESMTATIWMTCTIAVTAANSNIGAQMSSCGPLFIVLYSYILF